MRDDGAVAMRLVVTKIGRGGWQRCRLGGGNDDDAVEVRVAVTP